MASGRLQKIFDMNWGQSSCKSCAGGGGAGEFAWWKIPLFVLALTFSGWLLTASRVLSGRGVRIISAECAWNAENRSYVVRFAVRNDENVFKLASIHVQGRFRPPAEQSWPHPALRRKYEATTNSAVILLEPKQELEDQITFTIPGAERYRCAAKPMVGKQERFAERPTPEVLRAVMSQL